MPDFLLELFSEEIPARMQANAAEWLRSRITEQLAATGIAAENARSFVTPRRVALIIPNLPAQSASVDIERKGPKTDAPQAAIDGFLRSTGLTLAQLENRGGVYFANIRQEGRSTADILKEIIEKALAEFPWPKSMRWNSHELRWVRPLHSILCLFGGAVVPVQFGPVRVGNLTRGHRFLANTPIAINSAEEYEAALDKAYVIADAAKRKAVIREQAEKAAAAHGLTVKADEGLLEEVTGLVEWPNVLVGTIDAAYMDLPPEVLVSEMRGHQKYFALQKPDGSLADKFLITSNMTGWKDGGKAVIAGNERVLRARLADGRFFWDQDRKKTLEEWAKVLETVTYHAKIGTIAEKVERVRKLAEHLSENMDGTTEDLTYRAATLAKADLVTGMVGEFPELQGVMGRYYALAQNEPREVADAIRDHYKPLGPTDSVPTEPTAVCVALADKLDTLIGLFAIGEKPTGSKDPFALRRAALGVIRIILENHIRLPLKACFASVPAKDIALLKAHEKLVKKTEEKLQDEDGVAKVGKYLTVSETATEDLETAVPANLSGMLYDFFIDRLKVQLKDQGLRHDVISAVVWTGDDDLVRIVTRARALQEFLGTDDGKNLLAAYKRAANILTIEEKKDKITYHQEVEKNALAEPAEIQLLDVLDANDRAFKLLLKEEKFIEAMKILASLRAPIDHFFDKILVNCEQKSLRINRLRLLSFFVDCADNVGKLALIEG